MISSHGLTSSGIDTGSVLPLGQQFSINRMGIQLNIYWWERRAAGTSINIKI